MAVLVVFAFVAGAATAVSPCVLPVLPVALVYVIDALGLPGDLLRNVAIAVLLGFGLCLLAPRLAVRVETY